MSKRTKVRVLIFLFFLRHRKGDILCCEEIRQFVAQYNIKQQQVATLSGSYTLYFQ